MFKFRLFCLPYAGGSATIYYQWKSLINSHIDLCAVELAGRGKRLREPLYEDFEAMVNDVYNIIEDQLSDLPYAFFGHSMGSAIVFELAHKIRMNNRPVPSHLFLSSRDAPITLSEDDTERDINKNTDKDDKEFIEDLRRLGGIPDELYANEELLNFFLPIIKCDVNNMRTYSFTSKDVLDLDMSVLYGINEDIEISKIEAWQEFTLKKVRIKVFQGGHFYIVSSRNELIQYINDTLLSYNIFK
ncbi:alpha/beta fold hydrolase [Tissierella carlieri]|uniref:Alpha/beta fold hydrolase n=1 Tax=Tissierella carlieri TaxID=689904 RepID=A0ABT1S5A0_9FIRM|nr:alpha/beta fold hydrolase [Tissierella carlieri]MCQ4921648.1 alpha/beta fold hydrolase [Tissierella carlieri]